MDSGTHTFEIKERDLGDDGIVRITYDNWHNVGFDPRPQFQEQTGAKWEHFGCFMDVCCIACRDASVVGKKVTVIVP